MLKMGIKKSWGAQVGKIEAQHFHVALFTSCPSYLSLCFACLGTHAKLAAV